MPASPLRRRRYNLPFDDLLSLSLFLYHGKKKKSKRKSKSNDESDNDNRFTKALVDQNSCNYTHNNNHYKKNNNHKKLRRRLNKLAALEATYP